MTEDFAFTKDDLVNKKLVLPDTRIVDFSVENNEGELVIPSRSYSEQTGTTEIDFSDWEIEGTWYIRRIPIEKGIDAEPGITLEEYIVRMYLLRNDGKYLPYVGDRPAFKISQTRKTPLLGNCFFASGFEQLISGNVVKVIIPAFGENRQYIGIAEIDSDYEDIFYQFQVYRENLIIFDKIQDSSNLISSEKNRGNIFYFSPNLESLSSVNGEKYTYFWRVRASYKLTDSMGELYWSNWSYSFPFNVNIPPGIPQNLSVFS